MTRRTVLLWLLLPVAAWGAGVELSPAERRGRQIYLEGTSPTGGEVTAILGEATVEVPAAAVPCAGCHGRDGRGRPEGGVTPTDLTWENLTKPYGLTHPSGREHPAYGERSLKRAISLGIDPAGNELHVAMPRFRMSHEDMADLIAYLKRLGREPEPGVGEETLRIGTVLPPAGPLGEMGNAVRAALSARFEALNREGGVYGRRLELTSMEAPAVAGQRRAWAADWLEREEVFAVVGAFLAGADREMASLFEEREIPLLGPFTLHPRESFPLERYVFYLLPGIETQGRALARFAAAERAPGAGAGEEAAEGSGAAVLAPEAGDLDEAVEGVAGAFAQARAFRYPRPFSPEGVARDLARERRDPVVFLGSGPEAAALLQALDAAGWRPRFLATGAAADASLFTAPAGFQGKLFLALPDLPGEASPAASARYRQLAEGSSLPSAHRSAQHSALAAAEVLIEALKRAGRDLSRERLVEQLETFRAVPTGFTPPVTYGPGRRIGARGAYVVRLDLEAKAFAPAGGWVEVD